MQKIMFNDRYVLTDVVISGIKNNTRRIEGGRQFQLAATEAEDFFYEEDAGYIVMCCQGVEIFRHKCRYKLGEVVAQAASQAGLRERLALQGLEPWPLAADAFAARIRRDYDTWGRVVRESAITFD